MHLLGGHHPGSGAQHQTGGRFGIDIRLRPRLDDLLVQQILEHGAVLLEADGVDVGQVVGNHRHSGRLGRQAGFGHPH